MSDTYTWGIEIDGVWYKEGTPEYWQAIKDKQNEYKEI